ncbi:hypothetical protein IMZ48_01505, partial [Candidatus Bathyarchaeota archaeon]|nr:hypothetical protein [Candidatus Bathyarchaeota archaeon]
LMAHACPLAPVPEAKATPRLKRLVLSHAEFSQSDWDKLCGTLDEHVEEVRLQNIRPLPGGVWRPSLDILRAKTESRCAKGKYTLHISRLHGGEFEGEDRKIHVEGWWDYVANAPFVMEKVQIHH